VSAHLLIPPTSALNLRMVFDRLRTVHAEGTVIGSDERLTYGRLAERVLRLAQVLVGPLGVGPGTRVATFAFNSPRHLEVYYAVPLVGGVLHTLNVRLHPQEIADIIAHAGDAVILFDAELEDRLTQALRLAPVSPRLVRMGRVSGSLHDEPLHALDHEELVDSSAPIPRLPDVPEDAVLGLCYSSGTTGAPKGVPTTHRSMVLHSFATSMRDVVGISESDTVLPVVPMFHAFGWGLPYSAPFVGAGLVLHGGDSSPENLARVIDEHQVSIGAGVPTIWRSLLPLLDAGRLRAERLRLVFAGGSASPATLIDAVERHGIEYLQIWGMTETGPIACVSRPRPRHAALDGADLLSVKERTGTMIPGVEGRITDEQGAPVPCDGVTVGELEVRGPWVISEYFGDEGTERFNDGWLRTGDMGLMEPDGYLRIVDRSKDLVKSGGEWISSLQLEAAIRHHPGVADVAVVGVPSRRWDERPVAVIVPRDPVDAPGLDSIHEHLEGLVARWWLPDRVIIVEALPLTSVGKTDKRAIRARIDLELE
jgi:fatty-acyl-CoA synthase